jgi:NACHT domain.
MDPYASGKAKLQELAKEFADAEPMNEATTRLRIINALLTDCLGWSVQDIDAEKHHAGDFVDYAVGRPATEMIVEAKREGLHFSLPAGISGRRNVQLATLSQDKNTKEAIDQVLKYCQTQGVPVAVICNGHQLVAFYASRQDGTPPLSGSALCFSSLTEMLDDFAVLWSHLSRSGMATKNLQRTLIGRMNRPAAPPKLSEQLYNYPGFRNRSALETDLKMLGGLFIQDLESENQVSDDFLRRCYVSSGALSQYALVSKEILRARYSAIETHTNIEVAPVRSKRGISPRMSSDVIAAAMSRRPLVLIGDVGVGKSMFLRHLIRVEASDVLQSASLVFYVDFGKEPALETSLEGYVYRRLADQLLREYDTDIQEHSFVRAVYNNELNRFRRGIYSYLQQEDPVEFRRKEIVRLEELTSVPSEHLHRSLEHIRATSGRSSVVVLDNIDQRPTEFQERVFLIAQALAETWPATVFVALRPSTFYESRSRGSLAAYQPRVFTVLPTRVDEVISRRLEFASSQLLQLKESGGFPANLSLTADDLIAYIDVLVKAFASNVELKSILDNMSGGNLRLALTFLSSFVGSGYVSTRRILDAAAVGDIYMLPVHEFLRSMIYGDNDYYDPGTSEVCNLFDVTTNDGREHFLLPQILAHIQKRASEATRGDGFVEAGDVYELAQRLGYSQEQAGEHLERAMRKRLIESTPGKDAGGPYRITSVGAFMYQQMVRKFVYVDAMIVDTPITDPMTRGRLANARSITERIERAKIFREYLDEQWMKCADTAELIPFEWPAASNSLKDDIREVEFRAARAERRRARELTDGGPAFLPYGIE